MARSVLLVDGHELIRPVLRLAFERCGDFTVVAGAGSLQGAEALALRQHVDVWALDIRLPDGTGRWLIPPLRNLGDRYLPDNVRLSSTTKTQIARLHEKLGANNRAQAMMNAVVLGLIGRVGSALQQAAPHRPGQLAEWPGRKARLDRLNKPISGVASTLSLSF